MHNQANSVQSDIREVFPKEKGVLNDLDLDTGLLVYMSKRDRLVIPLISMMIPLNCGSHPSRGVVDGSIGTAKLKC